MLGRESAEPQRGCIGYFCRSVYAVECVYAVKVKAVHVPYLVAAAYQYVIFVEQRYDAGFVSAVKRALRDVAADEAVEMAFLFPKAAAVCETVDVTGQVHDTASRLEDMIESLLRRRDVVDCMDFRVFRRHVTYRCVQCVGLQRGAVVFSAMVCEYAYTASVVT